jgi:hypothetical protein
MMTREEAYRSPPPFDSVESQLRFYALNYANLINARQRGTNPAAIEFYEKRCERWLVILAERLSPARFSFELDEARRYGEQDAREAAHFWKV